MRLIFRRYLELGSILATCPNSFAIQIFRQVPHPTAEWLAQQIAEAFPWDTAPRYLVRDNDAAYGQAFTNRIRTMEYASPISTANRLGKTPMLSV